MSKAKFDIVRNNESVFAIRDLGANVMSVTNDISNVIKDCIEQGFDPEKQTFLYFDTYGELTQAKVNKQGAFVDYAHPTPAMFDMVV